jgi:sulfoxide reductase heme-binding subunit YedZ
LFWLTSRAAGITAMVLATLSMTVGLAIRTKAAGLGRGGETRALHEVLALATLAALFVHGASLLGDPWLNPGPAGVLIPFAGAYRPFWTGIGIIAGYGLAAFGLSYYARARIGAARWPQIHRFVAAFWVLGLLHSIGAGTDAAQPWFLLLVLGVPLPALAVLLLRRLRGKGPARAAAAPAP